MITDHQKNEVEPLPGMKIRSLYSGAVYTIEAIKNDGKTYVLPGGAEIPAGLDYKLEKL